VLVSISKSLPVAGPFGLLHNRSSSLSIRGLLRGAYHLAIHICKPPKSPPNTDRIQASISPSHDRIAPTPHYFVLSANSILSYYSRKPSAQAAVTAHLRTPLGLSLLLAIYHTHPTVHLAVPAPLIYNGRCHCASAHWSLASTT
jgi:hypothetical protein